MPGRTRLTFTSPAGPILQLMRLLGISPMIGSVALSGAA